MNAAAENREPLLRAAGVTYAYGALPVLAGVDLTVSAGEVVLLTGPSGSGKTTFLTLAGTLRKLQMGSLRLWGEELAGLDAPAMNRVRRQLGFIFQEHHLFEALNARQNVEMSLAFSGDAQRSASIADEMLRTVGLGGSELAKPRALSSGQRQRVAVARALAPSPPLILADEPTAALDRASAEDVYALLRRHAQTRPAAVLVVTHDARALPWADRVVRLLDGRIVADLPVAPLLAGARALHALPALAALPVNTLLALARRFRAQHFAAGESVPPHFRFVLAVNGEAWGADALISGGERPALRAGRAGLDAQCLTAQDFAEATAERADFEGQLAAQLFHQAS